MDNDKVDSGAMLILFNESSDSKVSQPFRVFNEDVVILKGYGFGEKIYAEPGEIQNVSGKACISMIYSNYIKKEKDFRDCGCSGMGIGWGEVNWDRREEVCTNGCGWSLSKSNSLMVIDVPGIYFLELSSDQLIGHVLVTLERVPLDKAPLVKQIYAGYNNGL